MGVISHLLSVWLHSLIEKPGQRLSGAAHQLILLTIICFADSGSHICEAAATICQGCIWGTCIYSLLLLFCYFISIPAAGNRNSLRPLSVWLCGRKGMHDEQQPESGIKREQIQWCKGQKKRVSESKWCINKVEERQRWQRVELIDRNGQVCRIWEGQSVAVWFWTPQPPPLLPTFAVTVSALLVASTADAAAQWDQPVSIRTTVQFGCFSLFGILHAWASHLHEGIHVRNRIREGCEVPHSRWATLVEHLTWKRTIGCCHLCRSRTVLNWSLIT